MKLTTKSSLFLSLLTASILALSGSLAAYAGCTKVVGGQKSEFTGDLSGLSVDKKKLAAVNKAYANLHITEKVFTGNIQTCTDCSDNYVTCD